MTALRSSLRLWPTATAGLAKGPVKPALELVLVTALVALLSACPPSKTPVAQTPPPAPPPPAPTASIEAMPTTAQAGQPVTITWKTENATDVAIAQIGAVPLNGSQTVTPSESVTYHLTAKGPGGVQEADARVTVVPAPVAEAAAPGSEAAPEDVNRLDVFFDLDDYSIRPDQVTTIRNDAQFLKDHPEMRIVVEGHCDELGSTEYNLALGDKRAAEVKVALEKAGISPSRMRTVSYGKELPFCTEQTEDCWRLNRRAHITPDIER
jgi:peptidoglycan-associated lipoprotein